jgi:hypothetical protein
MDCRSCGEVNAPGRRYCRTCGARLAHPCPGCHFFNAVDDQYCGGCGRRLTSGVGLLAADDAPPPAYAPVPIDTPGDGGEEGRVATLPLADSRVGGQGVSQSEIDGLFENIIDEESTETREAGA